MEDRVRTILGRLIGDLVLQAQFDQILLPSYVQTSPDGHSNARNGRIRISGVDYRVAAWVARTDYPAVNTRQKEVIT